MPLTDLRASKPPAEAFDQGYARGLEMQESAEQGAFRKLQYQEALVRLGERSRQNSPQVAEALQRFLDPRMPLRADDAAALAGAGMLSDILVRRSQVRAHEAASRLETMKFLMAQQRAQADEDKFERQQSLMDQQIQRGELGLATAQAGLATAEARRDKEIADDDKSKPFVDEKRISELLRTPIENMVAPKFLNKDGKIKPEAAALVEEAIISATAKHRGLPGMDLKIVREEMMNRGLIEGPKVDKPGILSRLFDFDRNEMTDEEMIASLPDTLQDASLEEIQAVTQAFSDSLGTTGGGSFMDKMLGRSTEGLDFEESIRDLPFSERRRLRRERKEKARSER